MNLLTAYFKYMRAPGPGIQEVLASRRLGQGVLGYACAALCLVLFFNIGASLSPAALFSRLVIVFAAELVLGYFVASFSALFLDLNGVRSSPAQLFILVGLAGFIKGLLVAFALIFAAVSSLSFLGGLAWLVVLALQIGFVVKNLMRAYGISCAKALAALLFAVLPVAAGLLLLFVFGVWLFSLIF